MSTLLKANDLVAFFTSSNAISKFSKQNIEALREILNSFGINVIYKDNLFAEKTGNPFNFPAKEKAEYLNELFANKQVKAIFDLSGGDLSNSILDYLDFDIIKSNPKLFFGYSDVSLILNVINNKCGFPTFHYQLRHLINGDFKEKQIEDFKKSIIGNDSELFNFDYEFIKGESLSGKVIGGNIRCLLKLAGTPYLPDFKDKILFLESYSGNAAKIYTYLTQYKQMGILNDIKGIILGTFTEMDLNNINPTVEEMLIDILGKDSQIPIIKTNNLGHGSDAKCLIIGKNYRF